MSVYAIILIGLMIGNGPGKVSWEMEQKLDLSGEWEGTWELGRGKIASAFVDPAGPAEEAGIIGLIDSGFMFIRVPSITDDGRGKLRIAEGKGFLGI